MAAMSPVEADSDGRSTGVTVCTWLLDERGTGLGETLGDSVSRRLEVSCVASEGRLCVERACTHYGGYCHCTAGGVEIKKVES